MSYSVKEIFATWQGEGINTGHRAIFCRFSGCNLWNGREQDRASAICQFCDTDFRGVDGPGGGKFASAELLAEVIDAAWSFNAARFVVLTGGEPLLQVDEPLLGALHTRGFRIAVETNGTLAVPAGIDWICVSPKAGARLEQRRGDELKLVYPQVAASPENFSALQFDHFLLQPMDGPHLAANTCLAVRYCAEHPQWQLSLQTHKLLGFR